MISKQCQGSTVVGMGTKVHCESQTPGYNSMRDMNEDASSSSWSPFQGDKNLLNRQYYNGFTQRTVRDEYSGYEKDVLKQKMIEHETIFRNQVYELHRLYGVQREMMEEAKRKELYNHQRSIETSSSSSILPSQKPIDEVKNWQKPSFPLANPGCTRPSILGSEVIGSPSNCMKGHNHQVDIVQYQKRSDPNECAFLDSRPSKVRKKLFDLQIPADEYIVTEEEEQFQDIPRNKNHKLAQDNSTKKYIGAGKTNDLGDTSSASCSKNPHLLADLNEPILIEEDDSPKFNFLGRSACHKDIRDLDLSAKSNSQYVDLSRDFLQNQCESTNGNLSNLSETNNGTRRGWLSNVYEAGSSGIDSNSITKVHQPEQLPTTSQHIPVMLAKASQHQGILPTDSRKIQSWTEGDHSHEFSNRSGGNSSYNHSESVVTAHISNPYPWYNSSDVANSWFHSVTSWGKPKPILTQNVTSLHNRPSYMLSETSNRDINGSSRLNPGLGNKLPTQNGFCQASQLVSKELSEKASSSVYTNLKRSEVDVLASRHLTNHCPKHVAKDSNVINLKSGKDLDLNVILPVDSFDVESVPREHEISNGESRFKDHSNALPWLRGKPVYNNVSALSRIDLESGFQQTSCNPLIKDDRVNNPIPQPSQNLTAASSSCHVRVKESASADINTKKLFGIPMFGEICTTRNDSSSTSASVQSYPPNGVKTKNEVKDRGFDINVAFDLMNTEFTEQTGAVAVLSEKEKNTEGQNLRNIDLNSCVSEDEDLINPSFANTSGKKIAFEIDLEAPAVEDTVEDLLPEQKQQEVFMESPLHKTVQQADQVVRFAAEAIVSISSYSEDPHMDCTRSDPSELPDTLLWFADVISSSAEDLEGKLCKEYKGTNGRETKTSRELDDYEAMTLQLTETREEDYMPEPFVPEVHNSEEVGATSIPSRPRKGPARRGRMRKDFQRDILPGLVSLSRHEVTEDLQTFGGLMRATGHQWNGGMTRRNGTRSGAARGRRRSVVEPSPAVVAAPVSTPLMQNFNSIEVRVEDISLAGWGKTTRRPRRQRSAAGNNLAVAMT